MQVIFHDKKKLIEELEKIGSNSMFTNKHVQFFKRLHRILSFFVASQLFPHTEV